MYRILAADIGGTNSRFASFSFDSQDDLVLNHLVWLPTAEAVSFIDLLTRLAGTDLTMAGADLAVFAVAGPIRGSSRRTSPPNIPWDVDLDAIPADFGLKKTLLINDFCAQAGYFYSPAAKDLRIIRQGQVMENSPVAVIGAGTGLGQCLLVPGDGRRNTLALPSEGGHGPFPFQNPAELGYAEFIRKKRGLAAHEEISRETVVSGSGLRLLHSYLTGQELSAREITEPPHWPTMTMFSTFYGRLCRDFVLNTMALGGLVLSGGLAVNVPALVDTPAFLDEFVAHPPYYSAMLAKVPIYLISDNNAGLWGAASLSLSWLEA